MTGRVGRRLVLLADGVGLGLGGFLLGPGPLVGGLGDVAGCHQIGVALSVSSGKLGLCLGGFEIGLCRSDFRDFVGVEIACGPADAGLGLADGGSGLGQQGLHLVEPQLGIAVVEFTDDLALGDMVAHIDRRGDDAARYQRRDVRALVGGEGAGDLEVRRNLFRLGNGGRGGNWLLDSGGGCFDGAGLRTAAGEQQDREDEGAGKYDFHSVARFGAAGRSPSITILTKFSTTCSSVPPIKGDW